tara:strand:+ start:2202 stop:2570 length:369 start_codon:yes stop_codon:yes gene_type:complete
MADDAFQSFRVSLMQEALPVGIAIADRIRKNGVASILQFFNSSDEPFQELRVEGEPFAESLRDQLDDLSPGLGNPVMSVNVNVDEEKISNIQHEDIDSLMQVLNNIDQNLEFLNKHFNNYLD